MQKIISLFQRNYDGDRLVRDEVVPGAEWVQAGEGVATIKYDGTCCMVRAGILYKRYDAKAGKRPPPDFEPAQPVADEITGHWPGWVPVGDGPEDRWHREAWANEPGPVIVVADGTYELLGPRIQGNPDGLTRHQFHRHGSHEVPGFPRDFEGIKAALATMGVEGIVWHHPDGRMVKIKAKDFGIKRG